MKNVTDKVFQTEKDRKLVPLMLIAITLGAAAIVMAILRVPNKFWVAVVGYIFSTIYIYKKEGTVMSIIYALLIIPSIISEFNNDMPDSEGSEVPATFNRFIYNVLNGLTMYLPPVSILFMIVLPLIRIVINFINYTAAN